MRRIKNFIHFLYAWFGALRYQYPSEKLLVIGVTGTSGKSSTVYFLKQFLEAAGMKVGALSTVEFCVAGACRLNDKKMTMLGRMQIQKFLREMCNAGCTVAIIETTSEGYLQYRHRFINYDTIVLTNLYPEHIEAHGGFENYKAAKLGIFGYVADGRKKTLHGRFVPKIAIVNGASENAHEFLAFPFDKKIHFSRADAVPTSVLGAHTTMNVAAAAVVARELGIAEDGLRKAAEGLRAVPGRIENIPEAEMRGFRVIVDYAFEPVAMAALYDVVAGLKPSRIIHVLGATGGGRDKNRRAMLGKFASEHAAIVIVTNEDPYDDDPMDIIHDVAGAIKNPIIIADRQEAIEKAVSLAKTGDIILVTGKGSEQGMVVRGKIIPWDDRGVVRQALKAQR